VGWHMLVLARTSKPLHKIAQATKNAKPHIIPLSEPALAILRAIPEHEGQRLVFLGHRGRGITAYSRQKAKLEQAIATARLAAGKPPIRKWTLHDLRRSVVIGMVKSRIREVEVEVDGERELQKYRFCLAHAVEMLVNHVSGHKAGVAGTYNV